MRALWLLAALLLAWAPAQARLAPVAERDLEEGLRDLYDLDYQASRGCFRRMIAQDPQSPFGYLAEAGSIWWQAAAEYGLFQGTPTLQGLFEADIASALSASKALMRSQDPSQRADAYYVSGMALGTRGQWDLLRGHYLQAYFDGKKAVKHLKKCLKIDPGYMDAYLGLGVYDYQAGRLPGVLKLSFLLGVRGDVKRGLERIELCSRQGRYSSREAAQFLSTIYILDQRDYGRALPLIQRLRQDYPESPYFQFLEAFLRHNLGDWEASYRVASSLLGRLQADPPTLRRKLLSLVCSLTGSRCLDPGLTKAALPWFERAVQSSAKGPPAAWEPFLRFCRGQAADVAGERDLAVAEYRWVLARADTLGLQARVRDCLDRPCGRQRTLQFLREAALRDTPLPPGPPHPEAPADPDESSPEEP